MSKTARCVANSVNPDLGLHCSGMFIRILNRKYDKVQNICLVSVRSSYGQLSGYREPYVSGLLIGAKKCKVAQGSYFV